MSKPFTPSQFEAATHIQTAISLYASAGSGKTSTLVERYIQLLKNGFSPRQLLTITFTQEAAKQLKERILDRAEELKLSEGLKTEIADSKNIGTLHSLSFSILNQYGSELGLAPIKNILDSASFFSAFSRMYQEWLDQLPEPTLTALLHHFNHRELKEISGAIYQHRYLFFDSLQLAREAQAKDSGASVICLLGDALRPLVEMLSARFHGLGTYSFDDLEHLALRILRESTLARTRISDGFKHILVDEFQDTSPIQWQIIQTLLSDHPEKLFIVGDPKQSIYGFRQAEPALFEEVTELILSRGGLRLELLHNFRTQSDLLHSINRLGARLFDEQTFSWSPMVSGLEPTTLDQGPSFQIRFFGPTEKTTRKEVQAAEPETVSDWVTQLIAQGIAPSCIAILLRNSDRIGEFSQSLEARGITTHCKKTDTLSRQLAALEIVNYLQMLSDPLQDAPLSSFLRSRYMQWTYSQILELAQKRTLTENKPEPLWHVLQRDCPPDLNWLRDLIQSGESDVSKCLEFLFLKTRVFPENTSPLFALIPLVTQPGITLFDIQDFLTHFHDSDFFFQNNSAPHSGGVNIMTVHAAKGLEFEHVILVDSVRQLPQDTPPLLLKSGLPPGIRYWEGDQKVQSSSYQCLLEERRKKDQDEARRILYVAATRAKKTLTLFSPHESAISFPKTSWSDLLLKDQDGRALEKGHAAPAEREISQF